MCAANWKALVRGIDDLRDKTDVLEEQQIFEVLRGLIPEFQSGRFVNDAGADCGPNSGVPSSGARGSEAPGHGVALDGVAVAGVPAEVNRLASQDN